MTLRLGGGGRPVKMGCTEKYPYNIQPQKFLQYGYLMFEVRTFYV
jgi:hypothetical protein